MKEVNTSELTRGIAKEVIRQLIPHMQKFMNEHHKKVLSRTKKVVHEEVNELFRATMLNESALVRHSNGSTSIAKKAVAARSNASAKAKAREMYERALNPQSMDDLLETAETPEDGSVDHNFMTEELTPAHETTINDTDPANMDFSAHIDRVLGDDE
jgi:hypothetical protein